MQKASLWQSETLYRIRPMISKCVRTHHEAVKQEKMYRDLKFFKTFIFNTSAFNIGLQNVKDIPVFLLFCEGRKWTQYFQLAQ